VRIYNFTYFIYFTHFDIQVCTSVKLVAIVSQIIIIVFISMVISKSFSIKLTENEG